MIIGLTGAARSGKDTVADMLLLHWVLGNNGKTIARWLEIAQEDRKVKSNWARRIQVAGPLKQFCREVFDWTEEHTDGDLKDSEDKRYKRNCGRCVDGQQVAKPIAVGNDQIRNPCNEMGPCSHCGGRGFTFLKPREAMQRLGYDWSFPLYPTIWADKAARTAKAFSDDPIAHPARSTPKERLAIVTDCRFIADIKAVADVGGIVIQVHRDHEGLTGAAAQHHGETVRDTPEFQAIVHHHIYNDGTLDDLNDKVKALVGALKKEAGMR